MYVEKYRPDIICVAEVKPKNSRYEVSLANYHIDGYHMFHKNVLNDIGRGVIIYLNSSLNACTRSFNSDFQEQLWLELKLEKEDELLIGVLYRSESGTPTHNEELIQLLQKVSQSEYSHKVIIGDWYRTQVLIFTIFQSAHNTIHISSDNNFTNIDYYKQRIIFVEY